MAFFSFSNIFVVLCFSGTVLNQMGATVGFNEIEKTKIIDELKSELLKTLKTTKNSEFYQYDENFNCLANCTTNRPNIPSSCPQKTDKNHVQLLQIPNVKPFYAYCNYDLDKNWMLIQRRQDGSENFYRGWEDYKNGFGNLYNEFWLGLERIHQFTKQQQHELWIRLIDYDGEQSDALYAYFNISDESEKYKLTIFDYSGNAGNQLVYNSDAMFSTYDNHNGDAKTNCAIQEIGAWWYNRCEGSNLNGPYRSNANKKTKPSVSWTSGFKYESFRYTHMAIRPVV